RSGMGVTGRLLWPSPSTARRAKITLSFEIGSVARVTLPTSFACSQSGLEVDLHRTSYPEARGDLSQVNVESFSSSLVSRSKFCGGAGIDASDASVAAFRRATFPTQTKYDDL